MRYLWLAFALVLFSNLGATSADKRPELRAPAGTRPVEIHPAGETVLPNGRLITPLGRHVKVAPHPYGLALSPDGKTLVTANSGTHPFSFSVITELDSDRPKVVQVPTTGEAGGKDDDDEDLESVFLGVAIAHDNRTLYLSEGENGKVGIFDLITQKRLGSISVDGELQGKNYKNSLTADLKLSPDDRWLYVLDLAHFRMVVIETASKRMVSSIAVGRMPFGLAVSPDGKRVYVSNVGMFEYSLVPGYDPNDPRETGLDFPPYGFPSKEATEGTAIDGKMIPGLGDPNVPESNSVFVIDVSNAANPRVTAKIRTGTPIGARSVGGSSPGAVVAGRKKIFVSNATQDSVTIINARSEKIEKTILLEPAESVRGLRGVLPFGMALSPDEKTLYVACAGINAVAVLDAQKDRVLGYFPTAWFPARVETSPDGKALYVANAKGFGSGPNGGPNFRLGPEGTYIGEITKGTVSRVPLPVSLRTKQVMQNNGFFVSTEKLTTVVKPAESMIPPRGQASSKVKHVVFIVKENRTFDEVFGDIPEIGGERVNAESSLARWGEDATVKENGQPTVEHANVTPNHHALARRFALSDNFYVDGDVSLDGHHWLIGNYPNELVESAWPASYGKRFRFRPDPDAPGRIGNVASNPWPESFLEAGSLWEHLARRKISFRNYGEGVYMAGAGDGPGLQPTGITEAVNMPMPQVLFENTSRDFATFNMSISDQYRFEQFKREFDERYASGKEPLPQFLYIWLPNDHTSAPRPEEGFGYRASYVADNDLALGKLVDLLSHSPFWKDMAIVVTEDDAQDGVDHVDAHRTLLMVISPYARHGVSHVHTSMASILKTFFLIFDMPPLNQYDAVATDLSDLFTGTPDFTPYSLVPSDTRIFDPAKVQEPGLKNAGPAPPSEPLDHPSTIRRRMREQQKDVN